MWEQGEVRQDMVCCQDISGVIIIIIFVTSRLAYPEKRVFPLRNHPRPSFLCLLQDSGSGP